MNIVSNGQCSAPSGSWQLIPRLQWPDHGDMIRWEGRHCCILYMYILLNYIYIYIVICIYIYILLYYIRCISADPGRRKGERVREEEVLH